MFEFFGNLLQTDFAVMGPFVDGHAESVNLYDLWILRLNNTFKTSYDIEIIDQ